jgi:hypothetical protein
MFTTFEIHIAYDSLHRHIDVHYQNHLNHFTLKEKPNKHAVSSQSNRIQTFPSNAIAGLVLLLLSLKLRHEVKLGKQNSDDLGDF